MSTRFVDRYQTSGALESANSAIGLYTAGRNDDEDEKDPDLSCLVVEGKSPTAN